MEDPKSTGSCLCGAIRFEAHGPYSAFRYCHCSRCRKASGSAHAANLFVSADRFKWIAGEARISRFDLPQASRFSVWFCRDCGSRVPNCSRDGSQYLIPAGLLDTGPEIRPEHSIFWNSRAGWYDEPEILPKFSERPAP